jgi:murein DD-endopeptidase MepM/ murein hydrolase activator NlpD
VTHWILVLAMALAQPTPAALTITVKARAFQPGELALVTLSFPEAPAHVTLEAFGKLVPVFPSADRTWQALVGLDLDLAPGDYEWIAEADLPSGRVRQSRAVTVLAKQFDTRRLRVEPGFVNPPPATQARIEAEALFLRDVYAAANDARLWSTPFVLPVSDPVNSAFGRRSVFNGEARSPHAGADFLSPAGRLVRAPNAGRVVAARDLFFTGKTIIVDHGLGVFSMFAHLSRLDVEEGAMVEPRQPLGAVGATGRVTGPHLHWALRVGGARVDPLSAIATIGEPAAGRSR